VILKIDSRRRIYLPKSIKLETNEVILVPMGSSYLLIPVPKGVVEIDIDMERESLKKIAEHKAKIDALRRLHRRGLRGANRE